jgi:beta-1,4-mannosyltransferase
VLFFAMLARLKLSRTKIVRTLHNVEPHDGSTKGQRRLLRILERSTDWFVRLNPVTVSPAPERTSLIPHGDYRRAFAKYDQSSPEPGRILYFGLIRPYKGVEELMEIFIQIPDESISLRVVGRAKGHSGARVSELANRDTRIVTDLRYVDDATLVREVTAAQLVVLPYRNMHNSGALLAALSLDRPVLAPFSPVNEWIAQEVGEGWLSLYYGELEASTLARALEAAGTSRTAPQFRDRDWAHMSAMHADLYRELTNRSQRRIRP